METGRKRKPSAHERQMLFFTIFFAAVCIVIVVGILWLLDLSPIKSP